MAISILVFGVLLTAKAEGSCRVMNYLECIENKALIGHVTNSITMVTPALELCQSRCFSDRKCVSYNLKQLSHAQTWLCELNAADHTTRPTFLVNRTGYAYCPIQNSCHSSPCPYGRLCTPDFAWNTYSCDDGGWTQWSSWLYTLCSLPAVCKPTRTRSCTSPPPQNKGTNCEGPGKEHIPCKPLPEVDISGCKSPLGMEDWRIKDSQITESMYAGNNPRHKGRNGRLRKNRDSVGIAGWAAVRAGEWIQIDLIDVKVIAMVASQGRGDCCPQWVTKYSLAYSMDGKDWTDYYGDCVKEFDGNWDKETIVTNKLERPIRTRFIRLIVKAFSGHPIIRMEFYGCDHLPT